MSTRELTLYQALLLAFGLLYALPAQAAQTPLKKEGYYALVIGNGAYRGAARLPNAVNDASAIRDSLEELGYTVIYGQDLSWKQTHKKINEFIQSAPRMKAAAFFYSGHAVQIQGANYLVTADASFNNEKNMVKSLWSMQPLFDDIAKRSETGLLILDSCRNNPFGKQIRTSANQNSYNITRSISVINDQSSSMIGREYYQSRAIGRAPEPTVDHGTRTAQQPKRLTAAELKIGKGLAKTSVDGNMLIAYATGPGQVAADGRGKHSPFTTALLKYIKTPDIEVETMFSKVRRHVYQTTGQRPWNASGLVGDPFYMNQRTLPANNKRVATFYRPEPEATREEIYTEPVLQRPDVKPADIRPEPRNKARKSRAKRKTARRTKPAVRTKRKTARRTKPAVRTKRKTARRTKPAVRTKRKTARRTKPAVRTKRKTARRTKPAVRTKRKTARRTKPAVRTKRKTTRRKTKAKPRRIARKKTVRKRRTARARSAPRRKSTGGSPTSGGFIGF